LLPCTASWYGFRLQVFLAFTLGRLTMNILLIGFRYQEIEEIQDILTAEFPQFKIDFAISIRDSWYRLKISSYDLIILDATCSESDSLVTYQEIVVRSNGIPVVFIAPQQEIDKLSRSSDCHPDIILARDNNYLGKLVAMLKKETKPGSGLDLSHRLQLKEDRQKLLQYFRTAMDASFDPLVIINSRFEIVEVNDAFLEEYRTTRKQVLGKPCYKIMYQQTSPCPDKTRTCPLKEVMRLGLPYQGAVAEQGVGKQDGQKVTIKALPIRNELNQVDEVMVIFRREQQPQQVQTQALFNRSLLELMLGGLSDGLVFCNAENKILLLNQAAENLLGTQRANLINRSIFNLPLGDGTNWLRQVLNSIQGDMRFNSLAVQARVNGNFVQIRFAPIFGQGNYYLGGFLYLTEVEESSRLEQDESHFILSEKIFDVLHLTSPNIIAEG